MSEYPSGSEEITQAQCADFRDRILAFSDLMAEREDVEVQEDAIYGIEPMSAVAKGVTLELGSRQVNVQQVDDYVNGTLVESNFTLELNEFIDQEGVQLKIVKTFTVAQEIGFPEHFLPYYFEKQYKKDESGIYSEISSPVAEKFKAIFRDGIVEDEDPEISEASAQAISEYIRERDKISDLEKQMGVYGFNNQRFLEAVGILDQLGQHH